MPHPLLQGRYVNTIDRHLFVTYRTSHRSRQTPDAVFSGRLSKTEKVAAVSSIGFVGRHFQSSLKLNSQILRPDSVIG